MTYFIFNEESLPFNSIEEANRGFEYFLNIVFQAFEKRFSLVRVSTNFSKGWYDLKLCNNYYVRDWLKQESIETERQLKRLIDRTIAPLIPEEKIEAKEIIELSEFKVINPVIKFIGEVKSVGVATVLNAPLLSFNNELFKCETHKLIVKKTTLTDSNDLQVTSHNVFNILTTQDLCEIEKLMEEEVKENLKKGTLFWTEKEKEFKYIEFLDECEKCFKNLSFTNSTFNKLWYVLERLNKAIIETTNIDEFIKHTQLDITDESDSVKNNPRLRRYREFRVNGTKLFFGYHVKNFPDYFRLHFLPDFTLNKVYIGYFGKHLPL